MMQFWKTSTSRCTRSWSILSKTSWLTISFPICTWKSSRKRMRTSCLLTKCASSTNSWLIRSICNSSFWETNNSKKNRRRKKSQPGINQSKEFILSLWALINTPVLSKSIIINRLITQFSLKIPFFKIRARFLIKALIGYQKWQQIYKRTITIFSITKKQENKYWST
jgi:hypothetical protein